VYAGVDDKFLHREESSVPNLSSDLGKIYHPVYMQAKFSHVLHFFLSCPIEVALVSLSTCNEDF
jgi:hypothetical protein